MSQWVNNEGITCRRHAKQRLLNRARRSASTAADLFSSTAASRACQGSWRKGSRTKPDRVTLCVTPSWTSPEKRATMIWSSSCSLAPCLPLLSRYYTSPTISQALLVWRMLCRCHQAARSSRGVDKVYRESSRSDVDKESVDVIRTHFRGVDKSDWCEGRYKISKEAVLTF